MAKFGINNTLFLFFCANRISFFLKKNYEWTNDLKRADIIPVEKKNNKRKKDNYRPASILLNLSKIYEKIMYNQLYDYFDNALFPSKCGFRRG